MEHRIPNCWAVLGVTFLICRIDFIINRDAFWSYSFNFLRLFPHTFGTHPWTCSNRLQREPLHSWLVGLPGVCSRGVFIPQMKNHKNGNTIITRPFSGCLLKCVQTNSESRCDTAIIGCGWGVPLNFCYLCLVSPEQWKKGPWLFRVYSGVTSYPGFFEIILNHNKDPY